MRVDLSTSAPASSRDAMCSCAERGRRYGTRIADCSQRRPRRIVGCGEVPAASRGGTQSMVIASVGCRPGRRARRPARHVGHANAPPSVHLPRPAAVVGKPRRHCAGEHDEGVTRDARRRRAPPSTRRCPRPVVDHAPVAWMFRRRGDRSPALAERFAARHRPGLPRQCGAGNAG